MIVFDNEDNPRLTYMAPNDEYTDVYLYAAFISAESGQSLMNYVYSFQDRLKVAITLGKYGFTN